MRPVVTALLLAALTPVYAPAQCEPRWLPPFGKGTAAAPQQLLTTPNGDLLALNTGGMIEGTAVETVARFDGVSWSSLGGDVPGAVAMCLDNNGAVVLTGHFTQPASQFARWNGTIWSYFGDRVNGGVAAVVTMPNDELVVIGYFSWGPFRGIARWTDKGWRELGYPLNGFGNALALASNGDLFAGGFMAISDIPRVARWDGTNWFPLGSDAIWGGSESPSCLLPMPNGDLIVGGGFTHVGQMLTSGIARWDGASWHALGTGLHTQFGEGNASALALDINGDVIVGGRFSTAGSASAGNIARWNGSTWSALGAGVDGIVQSIAVLPSGLINVSGSFETAGDQVSPYFARWGIPRCQADFNCDGFLSGIDFDLFVQAFESGDIAADFDADGFLTGIDYDLYVQAFEAGC